MAPKIETNISIDKTLKQVEWIDKIARFAFLMDWFDWILQIELRVKLNQFVYLI